MVNVLGILVRIRRGFAEVESFKPFCCCCYGGVRGDFVVFVVELVRGGHDLRGF